MLYVLLLSVAIAAHGPFVAVWWWCLSCLGATYPGLAALSAGAASLALLWWRVRLTLRDRPLGPLCRGIDELFQVHLCAAIFLIPMALISLPLWLSGWQPGARAIGIAYGTSLAMSLWGVVLRPRLVRVRAVSVRVPGLDAGLDGYRIAQLSDLHVGSSCPPSRARRWVERVNRLGVDLVALTGDYVTSGVSFHREIAEVLGGLEGRDGVVAVMGNHDYFGDGQPLLSSLRRRGIVVLRNEHVTLRGGSGGLTVGGLDDVYTGRADVARTCEGRREDLPFVVLAHDPVSFEDLRDHGAALVLSGHTHGGQLAVSVLGRSYNLYRLLRRHYTAAGLYRSGGAALCLSSGLGTTGLSVRIGTAPEIVLIELRAHG